ncbi:hypothetical protein Srufu_055350 [Streptomyces libani subsp. rufus]|nr:hypothetical protein Srufu_055350 [Streptomyces libani subsp. rufus]
MTFGAEFTGSFVVRMRAVPSGESLRVPRVLHRPVAAGRGACGGVAPGARIVFRPLNRPAS